jgi:hypothetical protein
MTTPEHEGTPPETGTASRQEPEAGTAVAILLAAAAVLAAVIAGRASIVADRGSDIWHSSVREHVKQAAAIVETSRFLYGEEAATAIDAVDARTMAEELRAEARTVSGPVREAVLVEAFAQEQLARTISSNAPLASDPRYQGPGGVPDVVKRLADERASTPDLVALDPDSTEAEGAALNRRATFLVMAAIPVALAFLFGALVHGFPRARRELVTAGFAFAAVGLVTAISVEVVL